MWSCPHRMIETEAENINLKRFATKNDCLCDDNNGIVYKILL